MEYNFTAILIMPCKDSVLSLFCNYVHVKAMKYDLTATLIMLCKDPKQKGIGEEESIEKH
ncbi:hypothetical protein SCA6_013701 [Theobroma cacao]